MTPSFILGIALGCLGHILINVGKAVQKRKAHVLLHGKQALTAKHWPDFRIWLVGTLMCFSSTVIMSAALLFSESPGVIASLTGIGLIALVVYSVLTLGEKPGLTDGIGVLLVLVSTSTLGLIAGPKPPTQSVRLLLLAGAVIVPYVFAGGLCLLAKRYVRIHGLAYGITAGISVGTALFLGDVALVKSGGSFLGQLLNPFPYLAIGIGTSGMVLTQVGFFKGRALEVVPATNAVQIVFPMYLEVAVYGRPMTGLKVVLTVLVTAGVILLSTGAAAKSAEAEGISDAEIEEIGHERAQEVRGGV